MANRKVRVQMGGLMGSGRLGKAGATKPPVPTSPTKPPPMIPPMGPMPEMDPMMMAKRRPPMTGRVGARKRGM